MIDEERKVGWVMCGRQGVEGLMGGREGMRLSLVVSISVQNSAWCLNKITSSCTLLPRSTMI